MHLDLANGVETGHGTDRLTRVEGDYGSPGDDVLKGTDGQNVLVGGDGDDTIKGLRGPDVVEGDFGNDGPNALRSDPGGDPISGAGGDDILVGDCGSAGGVHFFYEDVFDSSSPTSPDTLDGGADTDSCIEGETVIACESTKPKASGEPLGLRTAMTAP